jgi:class 3 adenylate cyclase/pimeloyl-ACP methyl ester carboxylesterase
VTLALVTSACFVADHGDHFAEPTLARRAGRAEDAAMERPETVFAWNGDIALAYQVLGEGPTDLLYLSGWVSNVELNWDQPLMARFLRGLAVGRRLIVMDPRGTGCSDRGTPRDIPQIETRMDDIVAVMEAAGSERVAIMATNEMAFVACTFAATYPERTDGLILYEASATFLLTEDTPWEWTDERWAQQEAEYVDRLGSREGTVEELRETAPGLERDPAYAEWWHRYCLLSEGPGAARAAGNHYRYTDIRPILPSIRVPVVVLVRPDHPEPSWIPAASYLTRSIAGSRVAEIPGNAGWLWVGDHAPIHAEVAALLDEIDRERGDLERVLATVLFTDIVGSTARLAELGDRRWKDVVERHHAVVRTLLGRFRGVEIDTAGDGFFATFDGPARAIRCAHAIVESVRSLGIEVRAGLHTGECERIDGKVGGLAVNIGARVGALAGPSEVLVSHTVKDLMVGSNAGFEDRGEHELKGIPGRWRLYLVTDQLPG